MLVLLVPIRGHVPGYLNFIVGNSRWDHGPDHGVGRDHEINKDGAVVDFHSPFDGRGKDRKSTRLNSSHVAISYAVFCLKKKKNISKSIKALRLANSTD